MRSIAFVIAVTAILIAAVAYAATRGPSPPAAGATETPSAVPSAPAEPSPSGSASPATDPPAVSLAAVSGSFDQPVYVTAPPGDTTRLFVVEQPGTVKILKDGAVLPQPFLDVSGAVSFGGEQGLLSLAFDPDYTSNGRFYVDYTDRDGNTRVVRYRVSTADPDRADTATERVILSVGQPYSNHNGGQLQFGPDGLLYVGMGDGGGAGDPEKTARDPDSLLGKLLRIDVDASPARVEVYAQGLRNPWRFSFDRETGALWIGDVGQNALEEIDYLPPGTEAGADFGWSAYEGTQVFDPGSAESVDEDSLVWPVTEYGRDLGLSVTGGYVYRGAAIPELRGFYLFGDYGSGHVWALGGPDGERSLLPGADGEVGEISSFGEDASGELYVVSLAGQIYQIVPR